MKMIERERDFSKIANEIIERSKSFSTAFSEIANKIIKDMKPFISEMYELYKRGVAMQFERFVGIDPSLRTGFVALSPYGEVIEAKEIERDGDDPARMSELIQAVVDSVHDTDFVAIEGFGYASQRGFLLGGIGWGMRMELYRRGIPYIDVAPSLLKKFAGAKGNANKEKVVLEVYKRWGFESDSNNVVDAFILAQIARAAKTETKLIQAQKEVLNKLLKERE